MNTPNGCIEITAMFGSKFRAGMAVSERSWRKDGLPLKLPNAPLTLLCLVLMAIPAMAQSSWENGPINGTTDAWTINFGYIVSNRLGPLLTTPRIDDFMVGIWEFPGDTLSSVDWSFTSAENGGTVYGAGTASGSNLTDQFISTNQYGYNIDVISVTNLSVLVPDGEKLWLNLQNAAVPSGDPVYWDENSGAGCKSNDCPASASESAVGTIPSEAFTIQYTDVGTTPEPSSILLFGSGIVGLAGLLRRKLF